MFKEESFSQKSLLFMLVLNVMDSVWFFIWRRKNLQWKKKTLSLMNLEPDVIGIYRSISRTTILTFKISNQIHPGINLSHMIKNV